MSELIDQNSSDTETIYRKAIELMQNANSSAQLEEAKGYFEQIAEYKDVSTLSEQIDIQLRAFKEREEIERMENEVREIERITEEKDKKKKQKSTIAIISIAAIAICTFAFVYFKFIRPGQQYSKALTAMENGNYQEAKEIFTSLGDYQDSQKMLKECENEIVYQEAISLEENKQYEEAIKLFISLRTYKGSSTHAEKARVKYIEQLYEQADYKKAFDILSDSSDIGPNDQLFRLVVYAYAEECLKKAEYEDAIVLFELISDYRDSQDKINEAKYSYASSHKDVEDVVTYEYLTDLKNADYPNAASLYQDIYQWKVKFLCLNTSEDDETTNYNSVSKYDTFYVHFQISGGEPGVLTKWSYKITWPDGNTLVEEDDEEYGNGGTIWVNGWYNEPQYGATGTATVQIYIDGKEMCSKSFTITN